MKCNNPVYCTVAHMNNTSLPDSAQFLSEVIHCVPYYLIMNKICICVCSD